MALTLTTLEGDLYLPDNTTPCQGAVELTPGTGLLVAADSDRILAGTVTVKLADDGTFTVALPSTDNAGTQPEPDTWNWTVEFKLSNASIPPFSFALPATPSTVNLADVARVEPAPGTYVVVPGPPGAKGDKGDPGDTGSGALLAVNNLGDLDDAPAARTNLGLGTAAVQPATAFDATGSAASAQAAAIGTAAADATSKANAAQAAATTAAASDASSKMATHVAASDPHGDRAASAADATAKVTAHTGATDPHGDRAWAGGQFDTLGAANAAQAASESYTDTAVAGEANRADTAYDTAGAAAAAQAAAQAYADAGDTATLASANAYTDTHSGGGGGAQIKTPDDDRIDAEIIVLTNVGSWAVVRTSGGTAVGKSVPAAAGDRVWVSPSFMYTGNQYNLDLAVMKGDGSGPSRYASSPGSGTTPGPEGYAPFYTQASSFPHVSGIAEFVVDASEIDGDGLFTVNLAYIAPSLSGTDQKVYFGSGYFGRWLMANIGPAT